jgi:sulfofructose kinase
MVQVLCIGTAAYDLFLNLDSFPEENRKYEVQNAHESGGGPAANAAALLSRWGIACGLAAAIGDDLYGKKILEEFRALGTNVDLVQVNPEWLTRLSIILVNRLNGSRTIINRIGDRAAANLVLDEEKARRFSPQVLLLDGHQLDASLQALRLYPDAVTILDAGSKRAGTEALAGEVAYLIGSEAFATSMSGIENLESPRNRQACMRALYALNGRMNIITLGEKGLIFWDEGEVRYLPAFPVKAVDTTGAGDFFHGAFAFGILRGWTLEQKLRFAAMAAALSVTRAGGRASIPALAEVEQALVAWKAHITAV